MPYSSRSLSYSALLLKRFIKNLTKGINFILPPHCLSCGTQVEEFHTLCMHCWPLLRFLFEPCCEICGWPFEFELPFVGKESLCASCSKTLPLFTKMRSAFAYEGKIGSLLIPFKHGDSTFLAPSFARWMIFVGKDVLKGADFLVPVPLHWKRLIKRQYNQAALLAIEISKLTGIPSCFDLKRRVFTSSQNEKTRLQRIENVRGAFSVSQKEFLRGKCVVVIDDVMTTGATLQECAKALKTGGVREVRALTVARVLKPMR